MRIAALVAAVATACALATAPAEAATARFAEAATARFYGVVYARAADNAPAATQDQQFALMHRTGVRTVRRVFSWAASQPTQGQPPDFAQTDALVARASRN